MKTIFLLRHAKSDWYADYQGDHNRPLNKRGSKAAKTIGRFVASAKMVPDAILTSSSTRTQQTLALAQEAGQWPERPTEVTEMLYHANARTVLGLLQAQPDPYERILIVGHEPTWSELAGRLIGVATLRYPTAALACIEFDIDHWNELQFGVGELAWFVTPKLLKAAGV